MDTPAAVCSATQVLVNIAHFKGALHTLSFPFLSLKNLPYVQLHRGKSKSQRGSAKNYSSSTIRLFKKRNFYSRNKHVFSMLKYGFGLYN